MSALFAAATAILAKVVAGINSNVATAVRTSVVLLFARLIVVATRSGSNLAEISGREDNAEMELTRSVALFAIAGLCEIGGGYLVWLWLRDGRSKWYGLAGAVILFVYGVLPTLQHANFGRTYAAYGGVFIVLSLTWGWGIDGVVPVRFDLIGGAIALLGVLVIMYWPRA